jgi:Bacterial PH domain
VLGVTAAVLVFRLPRSAYLAVLFLIFGVAPLAFAGRGGDEGSPAGISWRILLLAVPVLAAVFIARTATFVSAAGFRVRAAFGSRELRWDEVRGVSVGERSVYAVTGDGAVRLPCVRVADLAAISRTSGGRMPEIAEPARKYAPARRRRR